MDIFKPKIFTTLKTYTKEAFIKDVISGFTVAIIAMPLSIALAIASGATPEKGLYTAIIAGFLISALGGSRVQIGGPTGAFMVIVYGIVLEYGIDGMITATFLAGIIIVIMGLFKLGNMIKFIPYPVTSGFTSGIAITILVSQIKDFFGLEIAEKMPADFIPKIEVYAKYIHTANSAAVMISILSFLALVVMSRLSKKIPAALIVLVISSLAVKIFSIDVATIGSTFTSLSSTLPMPKIPMINLQLVEKMFMPALAIAILGSVESLLSAVVADGMISGKHRSNTELIAQGIANIASSIFGGMPATGAIARTVANINSGATTPVAGMVHAVVLLFIMMVFMPLANAIPLATLAAILVMVAINMGEWSVLKKILSAPKSDALILFTVLLVTVFFDLILAIEIGMVLASFLFMNRMANMTHIKISNIDTAEMTGDETSYDLDKERIAVEKAEGEFSRKGIYVYEINGPFFFGAAHKFIDTLNSMDIHTKKIILRMRYVNSVDATAVHAIKRMISLCENSDITLILCELNPQPSKILRKTKVIEMISEENIYKRFEDIKL